MSDGWGFTAFGLLVLICGWGVWAAAGGRALIAPLVDLGLVVLVAAVLFMVLRVAGRYVLEGLFARRRPHARWSHFFTGLYLATAGGFYVANTSWLIDGVAWLKGLRSPF